MRRNTDGLTIEIPEESKGVRPLSLTVRKSGTPGQPRAERWLAEKVFTHLFELSHGLG